MKKLILIQLSLYLVLLLTVGIFTSGCEPGGWLTIENQYNEEVRIFKSDVQNDDTTSEAIYQITIQPNETREFSITFIGSKHTQNFKALDPSGNILFSQDYKMGDLEKLGWRIVIPSSASE